MKTRKILNVLMVLSIVLIVLCGVMAVRSIKGPAVKPEAEKELADAQTEGAEVNDGQAQGSGSAEQTAAILVRNKTGIVTVERSGIAYEVDENSEIRTGDIYRTKAGAAVSLANSIEKGLSLGVDTELEITDADRFAVSLNSGEVFADFRGLDKEAVLSADGASFVPANAVFTVTAQPAAYTVYVYSGNVSVSGETLGDTLTAKAGQMVSILKDEEEKLEASVADFAVEALSDTQLAKLKACSMDASFCITEEELADIEEAREAEKEKAQQELLLLAEQAKESLAQEQAAYEQTEEKYAEEYVKAMESLGMEVKTDEDGNVVVEEPKYCTISIRCDTILDNMDDLETGKEGYVPSSGSILSTSKVMFTPGDTVFDVLQRACAMSGIQLEYSYTPLYESYYIEGINNLYEFDCGSQSGWMYKVNGWFPNYGCSKYTVNEGDTIVWCYTCKGLGADVGGRVNH